jgi:ribosome-associated protein
MDKVQIEREVDFKAVRSSGAGGQNVNKVSTKVVLTFNLYESQAFSETEKALLIEKLSAKCNEKGELIIQSSDTRSQLKNKEVAFKKLFQLLEKSLLQPKKRIATQVPFGVTQKRLISKKTKALIKQNRKKPDL